MISSAPFGHATVSRSHLEAAGDPEFPGPQRKFITTAIEKYMLFTRLDGTSTGVTRHDKTGELAGALLRANLHQLRGSVSIHHLKHSVTFGQCSSFLKAFSEGPTKIGKANQIFVGTSGGVLRASVAFDYQTAHEPSKIAKKRKSDNPIAKERVDIAAQVDRAIEQVKKQSRGNTPSDDLLSSASTTLIALLTNLRGSNREHCIESFGLSSKRLDNQLSKQPELVISLRICGGVAVPLDVLRRSLGPCFLDGMITTSASNTQPTGFNLPITEQGAVSEKQGQLSMLMYAAVAAAPKPPPSPSLAHEKTDGVDIPRTVKRVRF